MNDQNAPAHSPTETSALLGDRLESHSEIDLESQLSGAIPKDEQALHSSKSIGERLPYNDYTTIDWLHDLVKDSARHQALHRPGLTAHRLKLWWDDAQGWVAAFIIGVLTAVVAFMVDVSVASVADWKEGRCAGAGGGWWLNHERCGRDAWRPWSASWGGAYGIYVCVALVYGLIAGGVTMLTKTTLPAAESVDDEAEDTAGSPSPSKVHFTETATGKTMFMAAGSGIPEIKTILSGFVIPHFLDFKVLVVKAVGAIFAVGTGLNLGKEGPFVHISTCVGYLVAVWFPKYNGNGRKMREMLSVACSAGLSVAFGAPIGGVLFSYEVSCHEIQGQRRTSVSSHLSCADDDLLFLCRRSVHISLGLCSGKPSSALSSPQPRSRSSIRRAQANLFSSRQTTVSIMTPSITSSLSYWAYVAAYLGVSFARQTFTGPSFSGNIRSSEITQCLRSFSSYY